MWSVPAHVEPIRDRQGLPPGGSPATDAAYLAWRDAFLASAAERLVVRRWHDWPDATRALDAWRFDRRVFAVLSGSPLFPEPLIYRVRLRFLGIWLRVRAGDAGRAKRFVEEATL